MWTKEIIILFCIGIASATHLYGIIGESYHAPQPYKFGYHINDKDSSQHRHEEGDGHGNVRGSYGYTDDKGQYREVHYVADKNGFRAQVKTNEQGTANQNPADVHLKADPSPHLAHHETHHHIPEHHHIPVHHHIPEHHHIDLHHHIPEHHEVKIHHHVPAHHEDFKIHHHIPSHNGDFKSHHHVPSHHEDFKIHHHVPVKSHHHDLKSHHHFSTPLGSYGLNNFSPLHGFSYNPSAFHGYGKWPFQDSNIYGKHTSWKDHKSHGFDHKSHGFDFPHHGKLHGFSDVPDFEKDFDGHSSFNKDKYEKIMEEIKALRAKKPTGFLGGFSGYGFDGFDGHGNDWNIGHKSFGF